MPPDERPWDLTEPAANVLLRVRFDPMAAHELFMQRFRDLSENL